MNQVIRYFAGGVIAVAVHFIVLAGLVEGAHVLPVIATSIGFSCGVLVNYYFQYHITFASNLSHYQAMPKFLLLAVFMLQINAVIFWLLFSKVGVDYMVAQLVATAIVFLLNFSANKKFTFAANDSKQLG